MDYDGRPRIYISGNAKERRDQIVDTFRDIEQGLRTQYFVVEELSCGNRVMIGTPGQRGKAFDFIIHFEGGTWKKSNGNRRDNPTYDDISDDLEGKISAGDDSSVEMLRQAVEDVYNCEEPDYDECFDSGLSVESLLVLIEWLFICEDVNYWAYDGRKKFKDDLLDPLFDAYC